MVIDYMDKTLDLARRLLKAAQYIVDLKDIDLVAPICSDISIAIELCLQSLLLTDGVQDIESCSTVMLVGTLAARGYSIDKWLMQYAEELDSWKTGVFLSVDPVMCIDGLRKGQELLEYCKSLDAK